MQTSLFTSAENLLPFHGEAKIYLDLFPAPECDDLFRELLDQVPWKQEPIKMFGKEVMQPRLTAWYGEQGKSYTYSGITMHPQAWTKELVYIRRRVEEIAEIKFTSALLNLYRNGADSMGWHRDNEKELGVNPVIGSVSFGAARRFRFRDHSSKKVIREVELTPGSLLLMTGETQHYWEHQLPKSSRETKQRINITFRKLD